MAEMIAYLIHSFPQYSTTFINDEVDEMRRQGARLALFAVQKPGKNEYPPAFERFVRETAYIFPIRLVPFFSRHFQALVGMPWRYLGNLAWILTRPGLGVKNKIRTLFHFAEAVQLYPDIRDRGCRHVHVHFLLGGSSVALFMKRMYGLNYSLTGHGSDIFVDRVLHAEKLAAARFTRLATEYNAAFLRPFLAENRRNSLHVIPFGIGKERIPLPAIEGLDPTPAGEGGVGPLRLLSVGRLVWQKAQYLLLDACAGLARKGHGFHLRLVGEGPLRPELEARIRSLGLEDQVTMTGAMPQDAVWEEYRKADIFILSSVSEGSPFVIMEAMACGIPVVAPALHGIPEMIEDGIDGKLFRTGSSESLTGSILELAGNRALRKRIGNAAAIRTRQFDNSRSVLLFRRLFQNCQGEEATTETHRE